MDIHSLLKHLDLSKDESHTFETLLSYPNGVTVVQLAKKLNKPRTTLYDHLAILTEKGLARKGKKGSGAVFYPEDIQTLQNIFEEEAHTIMRAGAMFKDYAASLPDTTTYSPRFTVVDNSNAADIIFRDALRSRVEESYWFWPAKTLFHSAVPDHVFTYWHDERIRRKMHIKVLWPYKQKLPLNGNSIIGSRDTKESLRQIRILPAPIDATLGYGIYGNKVGFLSSTRENYGFIVDSKELSQTLKSQFDFLWNISKEQKK